MTTLSSEELQAQRSDFGLRLSNSMAKYGPLCVGIDPHRKLLTDWGYNVTPKAPNSSPCVCCRPPTGAPQQSKFQTPMFERYGAKRFRSARARALRGTTNGRHHHVDCLRGGLSTTISAIADAYFKPGAPLLADAITLLPYYGARSLNGLITEALENGRGVFIASLTSNPEGMSLQTALRQSGDYKGRTVPTASPPPRRSITWISKAWARLV